MMVATKDCVVSDLPWHPEVRLTKGQSFVSEESSVYRRYPYLFRRAAERSGDGARDAYRTMATPIQLTVAPAPGANLGREGWRIASQSPGVAAIDREGDIIVTLSDNAEDDMRTVLRFTTDQDGLESGGLLIVRAAPAGAGATTMEILRATAPGPKADRNDYSYVADIEHDLELAAAIRRDTDGCEIAAGSWHSHPPRFGFRSWSQDDLQSWETHRQMLGNLRRSVHIIAVRDGSEWDFAERFICSGTEASKPLVMRAKKG